MSKRSAKASRKQPRQARSQATVDAILSATIRILNQETLEQATTTRIAEVAGVSVGTLYQYFSDRDAILDALQDREFARAVDLMQKVLSQGNLHKAARETVRTVVRGVAALYAPCTGLHRVLAIEGLRLGPKKERVHAFDLHVIGIVRQFLAATDAPVRKQNLDAAAFVIFQSVRATMLAYLLEEPNMLDEDTLTEEIVDLVLRYLVVDEPSAARRGGSPSSQPDEPSAARTDETPRSTPERKADAPSGELPAPRADDEESSGRLTG